MKALDLLKKARAIIDTPDKWHKGYFAVDANGNLKGTLDHTACRFCAEGAIFRASHQLAKHDPDYDRIIEAAFDALGRHTRGQTIPAFNDHPSTKHDDVLRMFDLAIADLEADNGKAA